MLRNFSKSKTIKQSINRGYSYKKMKKFREKTLLTICQNRKSSLSPKKILFSKPRPIPTSSNQSRDFPSSPLIWFKIKPMALDII